MELSRSYWSGICGVEFNTNNASIVRSVLTGRDFVEKCLRLAKSSDFHGLIDKAIDDKNKDITYQFSTVYWMIEVKFAGSANEAYRNTALRQRDTLISLVEDFPKTDKFDQGAYDRIKQGIYNLRFKIEAKRPDQGCIF